ncbi:ABC transporter permease subunit [Amycolatopsis keratiniphila]|uniref:ABC transporter permease subunit n=1 Tax=Amycolatopsis keratiniphila TaxID=129921 RepID=UPI000ACAEE90|nr:ABC transporter permease subunit [Amycolatopsis keratiniphila]
MIWLTWRQFRLPAAAVFGALAALALVLAVTGPAISGEYATGIATCAGDTAACDDFSERFLDDHQNTFLAVTALVLLLPALIGLFWGAPLFTRELEAGTHRLIWNQSVTRTRWLAVKLGITGVAAMLAGGVGSLAVTWWATTFEQAAVKDFPRLSAMVFDARGVVPIAYSAFAFALGVTIGMLVRRSLPAMALTLAAFAVVQVAVPIVVRPHLLPSIDATFELYVHCGRNRPEPEHRRIPFRSQGTGSRRLAADGRNRRRRRQTRRERHDADVQRPVFTVGAARRPGHRGRPDGSVPGRNQPARLSTASGLSPADAILAVPMDRERAVSGTHPRSRGILFLVDPPPSRLKGPRCSI